MMQRYHRISIQDLSAFRLFSSSTRRSITNMTRRIVWSSSISAIPFIPIKGFWFRRLKHFIISCFSIFIFDQSPVNGCPRFHINGEPPRRKVTNFPVNKDVDHCIAVNPLLFRFVLEVFDCQFQRIAMWKIAKSKKIARQACSRSYGFWDFFWPEAGAGYEQRFGIGAT